jgi:hypothetical protein
MGDGVLVYFGYPQAHEDDAERAVRAGLAAIDAVSRLDVKSGSLQARLGIATGLDLRWLQRSNRGEEGGRIRIRDQPHAPSTTQRRMVLRS